MRMRIKTSAGKVTLICLKCGCATRQNKLPIYELIGNDITCPSCKTQYRWSEQEEALISREVYAETRTRPTNIINFRRATAKEK